ncbi:MAG TPA: hypothetical protein VK897_13020 [Anaerolineales bacterium]|nr:hypothetical protein [Anaerolineales bacterium]
MESPAHNETRDRVAARLYGWSLVFGFVMFFLMILSKEFFPFAVLVGFLNQYVVPKDLVWDDFTIVDVVFVSGLALSIISVTIITGFQAWTKEEDEYYDWLISLGMQRWMLKVVQDSVPKSMYHTGARLAPILLVLSLCFASLLFAVYLIVGVKP